VKLYALLCQEEAGRSDRRALRMLSQVLESMDAHALSGLGCPSPRYFRGRTPVTGLFTQILTFVFLGYTLLMVGARFLV
jgi:hypothetical protein